MERRLVVITGLGAVTVLGSSVAQLWEGLLAGRSGIRRITQFDASTMDCQIAGEIEGFNPEDYIERKEARRIPRSSQIALGAATHIETLAALAAYVLLHLAYTAWLKHKAIVDVLCISLGFVLRVLAGAARQPEVLETLQAMRKQKAAKPAAGWGRCSIGQ